MAIVDITGPARRALGQNYAFVVVGIVFAVMLIAAGVRAAPGVLILPLENAFGWDRTVTSASAAIGLLLYGLVGPFAAALMQTLGVRKTTMLALAVTVIAVGASLMMTKPWHLMLTWGLITGITSGCMAIVLGATVANRWFVARRGLVMGVLSASTAAGMLIFLPLLAYLAQTGGWQPVVLTATLASAAAIPLVYFLVPERPGDIGLTPYGATEATPPARPAGNPITLAFTTLRTAVRHRAFWYLFGTFVICGFTTNGIVGTHMIAMCGDHGISEVHAAGLMAMMGAFDLIGATASGWLTDRFDPRKLLVVYYAFRGLSLIYLPLSGFSVFELTFFAIFFGMDWFATVAPTLRLTNEVFGERDAPVVFGWLFVGHQIGGASAAAMAGLMRVAQGDYVGAFVVSGAVGLFAAALALLVTRRGPNATPAAA